MNKRSRKLLLLLLAVAIGVPSFLTFTGCSGKKEAEGNVNADMASYITPDAVLAGVFYPKRVLENPDLSFLPIKDKMKEAVEETGINPKDIESAVLVVQSFPDPEDRRSEPKLGFVLRMTKPYKLDQLKGHIVKHAKKSTYEGRPSLVSKRKSDPTIYMPDDHTLILATPSTLDAMVANHKDPKKGRVRELLDSIDPSSDGAIVVDMKPLRPQIAPMTQSPKTPENLKRLPKLVDFIRVQGKALDNPLLTVDLVTGNAKDAKEVKETTQSLIDFAQGLMGLALMQGGGPEGNQEAMQQMQELSTILQKNLKSTVDGNTATLTLTLPREKQIELLKKAKEKAMAPPKYSKPAPADFNF